mmetsp:Transcript_9219/g.32637  ORF Transcript_9219/g.32637 Transcript_9219/m.32637 type:complete len:95 (+) Transcript_9219:389-673(+)
MHWDLALRATGRVQQVLPLDSNSFGTAGRSDTPSTTFSIKTDNKTEIPVEICGTSQPVKVDGGPDEERTLARVIESHLTTRVSGCDIMGSSRSP